MNPEQIAELALQVLDLLPLPKQVETLLAQAEKFPVGSILDLAQRIAEVVARKQASEADAVNAAADAIDVDVDAERQ